MSNRSMLIQVTEVTKDKFNSADSLEKGIVFNKVLPETIEIN